MSEECLLSAPETCHLRCPQTQLKGKQKTLLAFHSAQMKTKKQKNPLQFLKLLKFDLIRNMDLQKLPLQAENPAEKFRSRVQLARESYQHWEIKFRAMEPPNCGDSASYSL